MSTLVPAYYTLSRTTCLQMPPHVIRIHENFRALLDTCFKCEMK